MVLVNHLLRSKGTDVWSIAPDAPVVDALRLMAEKRIGALLVQEDSGEVVGIFSERDYARKVVLAERSATETPVRDLMTARVLYIRPHNSIEECMALMTDRRIRHLPVLDDGRVTGVISIGDVVKALIADKEFVIEQLVNYITGNTADVAYTAV